MLEIKSLGKNKTELRVNDIRVLISYSTPVACIDNLGNAYKTSEFYSVTTTRHINQWLEGYRVESIPQNYFNKLLMIK